MRDPHDFPTGFPVAPPSPSGRARHILGMLLLALLTTAALWVSLSPRLSLRAAAQTPQQATLIVQLDDQARVTRPVTFTAPISGFALLFASGLDVVYADSQFGPSVCAIEGVGCPATDCFCDANRYWGYSYWDGSAWQSYPVGASSSLITQTGAIEGWRWGAFGDAVTPISPTLAADAALAWVAARQVITTGGYGSAGSTVETMLALGANHQAAATAVAAAGAPSVEDYLAVYGAAYSRSGVAAAGKLALAVVGAEACLPTTALTPRDYFSPTLGTYSTMSGPMSGPVAFAILGAVALSETVPASAVNALVAAAQPAGGWEWAPGWGVDTNATAVALQALIAAGVPLSAPAVADGLAWLGAAQNDDGGFPYSPGPGADSDVNSTAYVVQAILAAGQDPDGPAWTVAGHSALDYLLEMQLPDGSLEWQSGSGANLLATQQAIPALLGRPFPLRPTDAPGPVVRCPGVYLPQISR